MDFQIREAITANVKGETPTGIRDIVEDAIQRGDEHLLPGLGVFLEKWWSTSNKFEQEKFVNRLADVFHH